jgi:hypothetical protein
MSYNSGAAFRRALEDRLLAQSRASGLALVRLRKLVAFDRLLARLAAAQPGQWLLKGGVALQLRLGSAEIQPIAVRCLRLRGVDTGHMATYNLRMSFDPAAVEVRVTYDKAGNTLTVWFGNPEDEAICEEAGDEVVLMKNNSGRVIGFEKLNFLMAALEPMRVAFETVAV